MFLISPLASPSCLTPMVQQRAGGLDAIGFVLVTRTVDGIERFELTEQSP
jgi:hypothetical protein